MPVNRVKTSATSKSKPLSKSKRADVVFPVARLHRYLKDGAKKQRIGVGAAVYTAAVLEYLVAEVVELAGNTAKDFKKARITPRHILIATSLDEELNNLLKDVTFPSSGVLPRIHPAILPSSGSSKALTSLAKISTPPSSPAKVQNKKKIVQINPFARKTKAASKKKNASSKLEFLSEKKLFLGQKLMVVQSDITDVIADAIVHPTSSNFALSGQVGQAIASVGGQLFIDIVEVAKKNKILAICEAMLTASVNIAAPFVIHVNGPSHKTTNAYQLLEVAVKNCLSVADSKNFTSIAFPSIGSGHAGFPKQQAAQTILKAINNYFKNTMSSSLKVVYFVLYDQESIMIYTTELAKMDQ